MLSPKRYGPLGFIFLSLLMSICLHSVPLGAAERTKPVDLSTAIIQVANQNLPAVVYIEVTESREVTNPFLPLKMTLSSDVSSAFPKCPGSSNKK